MSTQGEDTSILCSYISHLCAKMFWDSLLLVERRILMISAWFLFPLPLRVVTELHFNSGKRTF